MAGRRVGAASSHIVSVIGVGALPPYDSGFPLIASNSIMLLPRERGTLTLRGRFVQAAPSHSQVSKGCGYSAPPITARDRIGSKANAVSDRAEGLRPMGVRSTQAAPFHSQRSLKVSPPEATPPKSSTRDRTGSKVMLAKERAGGPVVAALDQAVPFHSQVSPR